MVSAANVFRIRRSSPLGRKRNWEANVEERQDNQHQLRLLPNKEEDLAPLIGGDNHRFMWMTKSGEVLTTRISWRIMAVSLMCRF
jgi:hypothetical protein